MSDKASARLIAALCLDVAERAWMWRERALKAERKLKRLERSA